MSKQKKRVSLAQNDSAPRAPAAPSTIATGTPLAEQLPAVVAPPEDSFPGSESTDADTEMVGAPAVELGLPRGMETQPAFWFVLGSLTVGIMVMLGLLLMDTPAASARPLPISTKGVAKAPTGTAIAAANRPASTAPTPNAAASMTALALANSAVPRISIEETKAKLDAGTVLVVDVRAKASYDEKHIKGALNVPQEDTEARLSEFPKNKDIVLYCA